MSKPLPPGHIIPERTAAEQVKYLAALYRDRVDSFALARLKTQAWEFNLAFSEDELLVIAALDTPDKVQDFLDTQIYYNDDHASPDLEETALPPRGVLKTGLAHCFEGALFAYTVNYLHGHDPRLVLLEACQDSEHNLVLWQHPQTGLLGVNAHSAFPHLDGRPAQYHTIREIAESYYPYYYSDRTRNPADLTLVGYSEPFDLVQKYGVVWMGSREPLWDIYYTYIDDAIRLHYLFDDSPETHLYPLIQALKGQWIRIDANGRPFISVADLPPTAREVWHEFWSVLDPRDVVPRGRAHEVEKRFFKLTGTTPIDLSDNVEELTSFLEKGYRVEQLLRGR
jgi:hypothetical protein